MSLISNDQLLVLLAGRERLIRIKSLDRFLEHSESSFDSKITERKNINQFTVHPITLTLALIIRTRIFIYKIHSNPQPYPYALIGEINPNQPISYLDILLLNINENEEQILCYGYSSTFLCYPIDQQANQVVLFKDKDLILSASRESSNEILRVIPIISKIFYLQNSLSSHIVHLDSHEFLLVYHKYGVYVDYLSGLQTRNEELMWSADPICTSFNKPYLLIYTEKSIDIYNIHSGIWFQTFSLTDTYPLSMDGSISLCYDSDFDKHYGKLIYISEENSANLSLEIPEKISPKVYSKREGLFRNTLFNPSKPIGEILISEPTDFRHVEHIGRSDGLMVPSRLISDQQTNGQSSTAEENPPLQLTRSISR